MKVDQKLKKVRVLGKRRKTQKILKSSLKTQMNKYLRVDTRNLMKKTIG